MRSALGLAFAAALLVQPAGAAAATWEFSFTQLCSALDCVDLHGRFSGVDGNGDGHVALDELSALEVDTARFFPAWSSPPGDPPGGGSTSSFDYTIGGALSFSASASYYRVSVWVITGTEYTIFGPVPEAATYAWTPQTQQIVTAVPEPGSIALLGLGLAVLLAKRRSPHLRAERRAAPSRPA